MKHIGSSKTVVPQDIDRFVKVCRTLSVLIQKDKELMALVKHKVQDITGGAIYPMLIVLELYSMAFSSL